MALATADERHTSSPGISRVTTYGLVNEVELIDDRLHARDLGYSCALELAEQAAVVESGRRWPARSGA